MITLADIVAKRLGIESSKEKREKLEYIKSIHESDIPSNIRFNGEKLNYTYDFSDLRVCSIERKIQDFLNFHYEKVTKDNYEGKDFEQTKLYNFIKKMAFWFEMRYPDKLIYKYIENNFSFDDIDMKWTNSFDYKQFKKTLSNTELYYLSEAEYQYSYIFKNVPMGFLRILKDGTVHAKEIRYMYTEVTKYGVLGTSYYITKDFDDLNLKQVKELLLEYKMNDDAISIQKIIDNYQLEIEVKERLLDCVLLEMMNHDYSIANLYRAVLFADEFKRKKELILMYYASLINSKYENIIWEYINDGGSLDLKCFINYFDEDNSKGKSKSLRLEDMLKK